MLAQEWRPDCGPAASNRVALLQLASARLAVLVRNCRMGFQLPPVLAAFLRCVPCCDVVWQRLQKVICYLLLTSMWLIICVF